MTAGDIVGLISALFAGLLAGEEFVIRYGVRGPLASLDDRAHIRFRQALIRTLRILVPSLFLLTIATAVVATGLDGLDPGLPARVGAILALIAWIAVTLGGTVPINAAALEWDADAPPANWRSEVDRWEQLNTVRTFAAVLAFALLLVGLTLTAIGR